MKRRFVSFAFGFVSVFTLNLAGQDSPPPTKQPDFSSIAPIIEQFRKGADPTLQVHIGASQFELLKDVNTPMSASAARTALHKGKHGLPLIRFTKTHEIAAYNLDDRTAIELEIDSKPERWTRRTFTTVASYPHSDWNSFIEFGLENGMTELTVYEQSHTRVGEITFGAVGPKVVKYSDGSLHLSPEFYENMRVNPDYATSGGANGFVVLVHDPHEDVGGRFRLMSGLTAFFAANPTVDFDYLVEGAFPEKLAGQPTQSLFQTAGRAISDGGLHTYLRKYSGSQRELLVNSMLQRFLVDTPLAFQLLDPHETRVHGIAIDDNRWLSEPNVSHPDRAAIQAAVKGLVSSIAPGNEKATDPEEAAAQSMVLEVVGLTLALQHADYTNLNDTQLIKHLEKVGKGFGALGELASELGKGSPELLRDADVFKKESAAYSAEVETYKNALKRNDTMLHFIEAAARNSAKTVPLAFIGSYHTEGITRQLRADNIAYVVVEPRKRAIYNHFERDEKRFRQFLADPDAYFKTTARINKGLCSLTEEQVRASHIPYINTVLPEMTARQEVTGNIKDFGKIDLDRLQRAVASNGWLVNSSVEIGVSEDRGGKPGLAKTASGGGNKGGDGNGTRHPTDIGGTGGTPPPPEIPTGAFAFFDESDGRSRLVVLDKDNDRWTDESRYARLGDAMFAVPYAGKEQVPVIHFARHAKDKSSDREYFSVYKRDSKRVYLIEGSIPAVASVLSLSTLRGHGSVNVHVQLGELLRGGDYVEHFNTEHDFNVGMGN